MVQWFGERIFDEDGWYGGLDHGDVMGLSCGFTDSGDGWLKAMMVNRSGFFVRYQCIVHGYPIEAVHICGRLR